jgi:hypothetical protein
MVIIPCAAFASNSFLGIAPTNLDLLMNAVAWLRGKADLEGIAPKSHVSLMLTASPTLRARLILVPTVMAMLLIIGLGITVSVARRQ